MNLQTTLCSALILLLCLSSCQKNDSTSFTDWPILESYVHAGTVFSIKITRQIPFSSDVTYSQDDINNLQITVLRGQQTYTLAAMGDGLYVDSTLVVAENEALDIRFSFNNKLVSAYTYVPSKPQNFAQSTTAIQLERMDSSSGPPQMGASMPDPITLSWDNANQDYYLAIVENIEGTLDPIRDFGDSVPEFRFRKQPTTGTSTEIRAQEFQYFGTHRVILYHVLPDYAALYNESSTSSQNLRNPSTSIVNGYGIFTGLNSDTLYIEVEEQ